MQIDYALILSAGLGTRMGEIGKVIPKVMWPILNKHLIDLQICYCKELGVKKIFINTHYLADVIKDHIVKTYEDEIVLLHEDPILDSGGAIHNLAIQKSVNYTGNLLTINGDQFLLFDKVEIKNALKLLEESRAVLFGIKVDKEENYNETVVINDRLVEIVKNDKTKNYVTFSGLGLIKLDGLKPAEGATKFFQTVANFKSEIIKMIIPESLEYWDFGTAEIYFRNMCNLHEKLNGSDCQFIKFLRRNNVSLENINLYINRAKNSIDLEGKGHFESNSIIGCGKVQKIF